MTDAARVLPPEISTLERELASLEDQVGELVTRINALRAKAGLVVLTKPTRALYPGNLYADAIINERGPS